jgi:hypothetical protein
MGRFNSSEWRVRPVFDALIERDPTGLSWLSTLISLPKRDGRARVAMEPGVLGPLQEAAWDSAEESRREKALPAPRKLLEWLVLHLEAPQTPKELDKSDTQKKRRLLAEKDEATRAEALRHLEMGVGGKNWYVLEGPSYPDVYLRTEHAVVVVEGKLTEREPTTHTTWLRVRHQMLRHIDAAWDDAEGRSVYGFFVVNDAESPGWVDAAKNTIESEALKKSLPHRSDAERVAIAEAFLGIATWGTVREATNLPESVLRALPL